MELQRIQKLQIELLENEYDFTLQKDRHNELDFVHSSLARKLAHICGDCENDYYWRDNPSMSELFKIKQDVYFDVEIDVLDDECSINIDGVYLSTSLPDRIFNSIVNNLYNVQLKSKTTKNGGEFIFFSWV